MKQKVQEELKRLEKRKHYPSSDWSTPIVAVLKK